MKFFLVAFAERNVRIDTQKAASAWKSTPALRVVTYHTRPHKILCWHRDFCLTYFPRALILAPQIRHSFSNPFLVRAGFWEFLKPGPLSQLVLGVVPPNQNRDPLWIFRRGEAFAFGDSIGILSRVK
jgi:hypothetical protein